MSFLRGSWPASDPPRERGLGAPITPVLSVPPKRALGPGKRIASPGRSFPSGLRLAGAPLPSTGLPILKRRRAPPSRLRREPPKGQGAGAPGARRSGPRGRCPPSPGGKAVSPSRMPVGSRDLTRVRGRGAWPVLQGLPTQAPRVPKKTRAGSQGGHKAPGDCSKDPDRSRHRVSKVNIPPPVLMPQLSFPTIKSRLSSLKKYFKKKKKNEMMVQGHLPPSPWVPCPGVRSGGWVVGISMIFQLSHCHDGEKRKRGGGGGAAARRI